MNDRMEITQDDINQLNNPEETPTGGGLVVDTKTALEQPTSTVQAPGGITPEVMEHVNEYMQERPAELEEMQKTTHATNEFADDDDEEETQGEEDLLSSDPNVVSMDDEEYQRRVDKATIIINKANLSVGELALTEEEHAKLEKVRTIEINEIEEVDLKTINIINYKKKHSDAIIEKINTPMRTNVVLVASGYTAVVRGCSIYELMELFIDKDSGMTSTFISKWTILHKCIESTSIGKLTFDEFLKHTAFSDMDMLIWGVLSATYPRMDTYTYECSTRSRHDKEKTCGNKIEIRYFMKNLLRGELLSDKMLEMISEIVDKTNTVEGAKEVHEKSLVMSAKRFRLTESNVIVTLQMKSAYDMIYNLSSGLDALNKMDKEKYQNASILSISIQSLFIPAEDGSSYYEVTDSVDIIKGIYKMTELDNAILIKMINNLNDGIEYVFGFANVACDKCGKTHQVIKMNIEQMLFHKYQRAMQIQ